MPVFSPAPAGTTTGAFAELAAIAGPLLPLPTLTAERYAAGHAAFEARSTQRALLRVALTRRLAGHTGAVSVLSVGCGDGALDAQIAQDLAAPGRLVRYAGLDPHAGSAGRFLASVGAVDGVHATASVGRAERFQPDRRFDVVLCVHALYYVDDLASTLTTLAGLLMPGGELVIALAPRGELNALAAALAPDLDGHRQWWSHDLADALVAAGLDAQRSTLHGRLQLADCHDRDDQTGRLVLDFAVQAELPPVLREPVLDHLVAVRLPGQGLVVDHPVDLWSVRTPGDEVVTAAVR
ncbi:MAG: class I SAM-dependent methyltransferase [Frankiales bacterium]|nr:class I SAM-dependent methyltransferase [Frankiales bacterium]